jgi:hypothetical protein
MSKKILPMSDPSVIGYLHHAYTLSITGNIKGFEDWFYSNYIQLYDDYLTGGLNFYEHDFTRIPQPLLSSHSMCIDAFARGKYDVVEFAIHCLELGYYFYTFVDERFIPGKPAYKAKQRFPHEMLIFGYDSDSKQFEGVGFSSNFQYEKCKISFENLTNGFNNLEVTERFMNNIHLLQPKHDVEYPFNLKLVRELLEDYCNSNNTSERFSMIRQPFHSAFGLAIYDFLIEYFELVIKRKVQLKVNSLHILWEHKKCMVNRVLYMQSKHNLLKGFDIAPLKEIERLAYKTRDELIVFSLSNNAKCFDNIIKYLGQLKEKEQVALGHLLDRVHEDYIIHA